MAQNPNQPRAYDVVLGGKTPTPIDGAVLGGLSGVKRRLLSPVVTQRVDALKETLKYGQQGKDLLIWGLKDSSWQVRQTAYLLLREPDKLISKSSHEPALKQALQDYNPYQLFQCLYRHSTPHSTAYSVTISPDSQLLISGGNDKNIKVRSLHTGRILRTFSGHSGSVYAVAISPDGQTLVSGSWDSTIKVWNLNTAGGSIAQGIASTSRILGDGLLQTLSGHSAEVNSVTISPDGQTLVSGSEDETINLWELRTGELKTTLTGHSKGVKSVAVSPDGKTLASGSADETINLWNLRTGELLRTLAGHSNGVKSVAISPDGQILVSSGQDKTIQLWHLHTGELYSRLTEHWGEVNSVVISSDGQTLISGSRDETIRLWHLATGAQLYSLEGHQAAVAGVAISPDGQKIVSSSWDQTIRVWGVR